MTNQQQCDSCKFCVYDDYGYSNWTVEGTTKSCAKGMHEAFDNFYGNDKVWSVVPNPCEKKEIGNPIVMDCEGENMDELTPEQREIWELR